VKFVYEGYDERGRPVRGSIEAESALDVGDLLAAKGLYVDTVKSADEEEEKSSGLGGLFGPSKGRLVAGFSRDLAVLVETGTPLVDAVGAIERQCQQASFRKVISDVRSTLEDGTPFSEALAVHPGYFDTVYRSLISAGESGGGLSPMLDRLAELTRRQLAIKQQLVGSMTYPAALLVISGGVLAAMFAFVLPRFAGLFETLQAPLPPSTEMMLVVSMVVRGYWWAILIGIVAAVAGSTMYFRSEQGKEASTAALLRVPVVGKLMRDFTLARIARVLGTLLQSSVPFLEALELTRLGVSNPAYMKLLQQAETSVTDGEPVSAPFGRSQLISPAFAEAMRSGEQSGRLGPVLSALATHLEEDNEVKLRAVCKIIEPSILSLLGVMVGIVAISLFLPLFDLTAMTQGGK